MPYTLGARHILSGTGSISIASPIGLKVAISGIPNYLSRNAGTPLEYFNLGSLVPGNADGSLPRVPLHHAAELVYPLPDSLTLLGYDLVAGATATVDELVAVAVPGALAMPWDRSPTTVVLSAIQTTSGPANASAWTFTVPAGRKLWIADAELIIKRLTPATSAGLQIIHLYRAGTEMLTVNGVGNAAGATERATLSPSGLVSPAAETVSATYFTNDTGGSLSVSAILSGYTFDA